ncbi:hypothetical protein PDR5_53230 [Pseudomonas sp. DR 5-09]|nr:hypothetical protein PDR5_53230 [Pseudomonas sp. DR 5-09]
MTPVLCAGCQGVSPHPSPLPEGEGTDRVVLSSYADVRNRVELRL